MPSLNLFSGGGEKKHGWTELEAEVVFVITKILLSALLFSGHAFTGKCDNLLNIRWFKDSFLIDN